MNCLTHKKLASRSALNKRLRRWFVMVPFLMVAMAGAQNFSIDFFTIDGGGGTSTGGEYELTGTIGQSDAGVLEAGEFSLIGGFWGISIIQGPPFSIQKLPDSSVRVFWSAPGTGLFLEETSSLGAPFPSSWAPLLTPYNTNGMEISITIPASEAMKFYRLRYY